MYFTIIIISATIMKLKCTKYSSKIFKLISVVISWQYQMKHSNGMCTKLNSEVLSTVRCNNYYWQNADHVSVISQSSCSHGSVRAFGSLYLTVIISWVILKLKFGKCDYEMYNEPWSIFAMVVDGKCK